MVAQPREQRVKRLGDEILNHVRAWLDRERQGDPDFRFRVNRWVFSRLQLDYRQESGSQSSESAPMRGMEEHKGYFIRGMKLPACRGRWRLESNTDSLRTASKEPRKNKHLRSAT